MKLLHFQRGNQLIVNVNSPLIRTRLANHMRSPQTTQHEVIVRMAGTCHDHDHDSGRKKSKNSSKDLHKVSRKSELFVQLKGWDCKMSVLLKFCVQKRNLCHLILE